MLTIKVMKRSSTFFSFLFFLLVGCNFSPALGRTYRTLSGVEIEASFVDLKSKKIVVFKLDKTGKLYEIPLANLDLSDQHFIRFSDLTNRAKGNKPDENGKINSSKTAEIALPIPSGPAIALLSSLRFKLVAVDGKSVKKYNLEKSPDYYALYFAASWCPACSQFTPQLSKYYKNNIDFAAPKFEVIFISRDNSAAAMEQYMLKTNMPWPAIRYQDPNREKLRKRYAPRGTPSLVLVDRAGKVISDSAVDGKYRSAFAVKQDLAAWFTEGERTADGSRITGKIDPGKRVSVRNTHGIR